MTRKRGWRHRGERDKEPLHYTACGLDDIYLLSGYEVERTEHGEGTSVRNADQLHRAIGRHLASQKKALTPKELRFLRVSMDLSQSNLGKMLGLSSQQVARWEKGQCEISGPADVLIRGLFIQFDGGKLDLQGLAKAIDEMEAPVSEKSFFENTGDNWESRKAA